jgi:hypothetical protein
MQATLPFVCRPDGRQDPTDRRVKSDILAPDTMSSTTTSESHFMDNDSLIPLPGMYTY